MLLRGCAFSGEYAASWEADLLEAGAAIPEDIKLDVWGARRTIVFVEGEPNSLDRRIYEAVFPGVTFASKGGWPQVVRALEGVAGSSDLHWLKAHGLIDRDSGRDGEPSDAARQSAHLLDCFAVESLYYDPKLFSEVGRSRCEETSEDFDALLEQVDSVILEKAEDLRQRSADYDDRLQQDIDNRDIEAIIADYPIKQSGICDAIAKKLQFPSRGHYERAVIGRLHKDPALRQYVAGRCGGLQEALEQGGQDAPSA